MASYLRAADLTPLDSRYPRHRHRVDLGISLVVALVFVVIGGFRYGGLDFQDVILPAFGIGAAAGFVLAPSIELSYFSIVSGGQLGLCFTEGTSPTCRPFQVGIPINELLLVMVVGALGTVSLSVAHFLDKTKRPAPPTATTGEGDDASP